MGSKAAGAVASQDDLMAAFARRLQYAVFTKQLRDGERITQDMLARGASKEAGFKEPLRSATASKWLLAQSMPDWFTGLALARYLDVDPGWLFFGALSTAQAPYNAVADLAQSVEEPAVSGGATRRPSKRPRTSHSR